MSEREFAIERATAEDRAAVLEVMRPWNMHHVPSPEMEELDLTCFFVARSGNRVVGAAGYKVLSQTVGKTTLLGVLPEYAGNGIGKALQDARLGAMASLGIARVITNADRAETINWYKRRYGYREVGTLKKLHSFGDVSIDHWTTLELDLKNYLRETEARVAQRDYLNRYEPHPLAPYPPLLINACITGMRPSKEQTPLVPITTEEIIEDAVRVCDAGAQIVHLHARDEDGRPTWKAAVYEKLLVGIRRERPQLICCVSTSGRDWSEIERRSEVLFLRGLAKPDFASLTLGSMNFITGASVNSMETIQKLAEIMKSQDIRPELEIFDVGMIGFAKYLERKGYWGPDPKYFNLLLGNLGTLPATIANLGTLVQSLPENSVWSAAGIGVFQLPMNVAAIVAGGGIRVGVEDCIFYDFARSRLASNVELVQRVLRIASECQRPLATPQQARKMLGLKAG